MTAPITLPPVDTATLAELRRRYEETPKVESRTRYQMLLLAQQDYQVPRIARIVLWSEDTVDRVLKRFEARRTRRGAWAHSTRARAEGHSSVGSREARACLSWILHAGQCRQCELEHRVASFST